MPVSFIDQATSVVVPQPGAEPPIGYGGYPRALNLSSFIADANVTPPVDILSAAVLAGIEMVENRCQRHFVAGVKVDNTPDDSATRVFDPPTVRTSLAYGGYLDLGPYGDLARLDSVVYQPSNSTPQTFTAGTQFRAMPLNAPSRGKPYTYLEMLPRWWSPMTTAFWGSIAVTGLWGYATALPADVWMAMLGAAALSLFSTRFRAAGVPVGIKSWSGPGGVQTVYDPSTLTARLAQWQASVDQVVQTYARLSI